MRRGLHLALLSALLGLSACAGWLWGGGAPRARSGDAIRIPHGRHADAKVDCAACHEEVYESKALGDRVVPPEKTCLTCHKDRKADCAMCHTAVKKRQAGAERPTPSVRMSHADHIERVKEDCRVCHVKLPDPFATVETKPSMASCLGCHEHREEYEEGRCARCHTDLSRYGVKPVASYTHAGNFVREHARPARSAPETCATCHDQTFCTDCHAGTVGVRIETKQPERVERDFIHRNDFISRHAIEARADSTSCARCHGRSFCENCHTAQGLTQRAPNARDPHPQGWALPGSPSFHGDAARRDIASCAACHDQGAQSNCVGCHKVGGIGGNPHPSGFTDRHDRSEIGRNGMCAACHSP
jgi:hypothetical protein